MSQVELFHHSRDVPATISKLIASLDRATSIVIKQNPRFENASERKMGKPLTLEQSPHEDGFRQSGDHVTGSIDVRAVLKRNAYSSGNFPVQQRDGQSTAETWGRDHRCRSVRLLAASCVVARSCCRGTGIVLEIL